MIFENAPKMENNVKKFAVDLFVELHSNDEAIFMISSDFPLWLCS